MKIGASAVCAAALLVSSALPALAAPVVVPRPLEPWVPWVLHGEEAARCPFLQGRSAGDNPQFNCLWPSRLNLSVDEKSGTFSQQWTVFDSRGSWVSLPGDAKAWPQDVRIDGAAAVVSDASASPRVHLGSGTHTVSGSFLWDTQPESLQIPSETGLLALKLRGKAVDFPSWGSDGKLWLQRQLPETPEENRLVVTVERRLDDEIPAMVTTEIQLSVSGKSREATVGPALLTGYTALSIDSPLPVRLEPDGTLRIQVRPGDFTLGFTARSAGPVSSVTEPKVPDPWGDEVVWVFSARSDLRQVSLEGAAAIDPQQTRLPEAWKGLPAYRLKPGESLKLVESRRGDPEPAPDELNLQRTLWLDFDGSGYTVHDVVRGALHRGWRLEVAPALKLGRVAVGGQNQFITRMGGAAGPLGVEIRQGRLDLEADARLEGDVDHLPAVGWQHDFHQVSERLNLPPGWRLFHASGADDVSPTWVKSWTLLDLFVVLITALAAWRIFGTGWGIVALLTLGLSYHEAGSPQWLWLVLLGFVALVRALPQGKIRKLSRLIQLGLSVVLVLAVAAFVVQQVRQAMYPALENEAGSTAGIGFGGMHAAPMDVFAADAEPMAPPPAAAMAPMQAPIADRDGMLGGEGGGPGGDRKQRAMKKEWAAPKPTPALAFKGARSGESSIVSSYSQQADPNAAIQTGAGLTSWSWRSATLAFSGPVEAGQEIQLYLIPPWLESLLDILRVILCALLTLCLLGFPGSFWPSGWTPKHAAAAIFLLGTLFALRPARADELPDQAMLDALKKRLLEKPECAPNCASLQRLVLTVDEGALKAQLEVGAAADTAVQLPGDAKQWRPTQVEIDGHPAPALWRDGDGSLWIEVPTGAHKIGLEGALPRRDQVQIALPMKPHYTVVHATGWTVQGLQDDGQVDDNLQLSRVARAAKETEDGEEAPQSLQPGDLPGFARVQRTLQIGLTWNVHTEVSRVSPDSSALVLAVPLLPGEQVTTADVHVVAGEGGKVAVNLNPGQSSMTWDSVLPQKSPLRLEAPKDVAWTERWRLDVSPIWHADAKGIPVIHGQDQSGNRLPEWWPWPGEWVSLDVTRPAGVPGPTLTIDDSALRLTPGLRATDAQLVLRLRSSRGGEHELQLPEGAKLQKLVVDEQSQPVRQSGDKVTLSLKPGAEAIELDWTEARGMGTVYEAPVVGLGSPSVNVHTDIQVPSERFVLLVSPSRLGPAVLFWGVLVAMLLLSFGLGSLGLAPLGTAAWFTLSLGFTQAPVWAGVLFVGWLLALGWRRKHPFEHRALFNLGQIALVCLTLWALAGLFGAVESGLLGQPDMQVTGNGSSAEILRWYVDRSGATLPQPWVISLPFWVYRAAMLAWALWLAVSCIKWVMWAWGSFGTGGLWKGKPSETPVPPKRSVPPPPPPEALLEK